MGRFRLLVAAAVIAAACAAPAAAGADGWAGTDPSSNFPQSSLPDACDTDPTGAVCTDAAVQYLNQARASLGQPAYQLPTNFASLTPGQQALVLVNLDRAQYGLPPIPGLTDELNQAAADGVQADNDPTTDDSAVDSYTSNWAGGFPNLPLAYGAWMYDDGPGSGNVDCNSAGDSGCWGHRHDILWKFDPGTLAMGFATGTDPQGDPGYALLLVHGDDSYHPSYTDTWSALAALPTGGGSATGTGGGGSGAIGGGGAGGGTPTPTPTPKPVPPKIFKITSLRVSGHHVSLRVAASSGLKLSCALTRRGAHGFGRDHFRACSARASFSHLRPGRYRLRVRSSAGAVLTRLFTVH
jgi:hypothetical protein